MTAAVLSGNRNFEARVHPQVRANYLASPMLVVAFALAGRVDIDLSREPLGTGKDGRPVYLKDIWPSPAEVRDAMAASLKPELFEQRYGAVFEGDEAWQALQMPEGSRYAWDPAATYVAGAAVLHRTCRPSRSRSRTSADARVLAVLGDSVTTDHISPAGSIPKNGPAARYLREHGVAATRLEHLRARARGNHEVMMRGTFGNVRIKNALVPDKEGNWTLHFPTGEVMSIYDAAMRYQADGHAAGDPGGQGVRHRLEPRLGREGARAPGREGGDRRELRADPPEQPGGHGRAAAGLSGRAPTASRSASPARRPSASRGSQRD